MAACFPFKHVFMQYGNSVTWSICPKFQQLLFFHAVRSMSELCLVSKLSSVFLRREHVFQTSLLLPFSKLVCKPVAKLFSSTCSDNRTKMLCTTQRAIKPRKGKGTLMQASRFVDRVYVVAKGGNGGDGMMSFTSEFCKEWAGPDGGNGGNGGHVIFQGCPSKNSLSHIGTLLTADSGIKGRSKDCHGRNAEHLCMKVPLGTLVRSDSGLAVGSLDSEGELFVAARGGTGGKGNGFFLSNENRAPAKMELGAVGQENRLHLELRIIADVGLIGFPNAGKSTLLRAISRARPKVAAYPFTTLQAHVGIVEYDDYEQVSVADIPGIINGAHRNRGLGLSFLRHIQSCACLIYVLDLSKQEPLTQLQDLKYELEQYKKGLSTRPHAIIGNKVDLPGTTDDLLRLEQECRHLPVFAVSAKFGVGLDSLLSHLRHLCRQCGRGR